MYSQAIQIIQTAMNMIDDVDDNVDVEDAISMLQDAIDLLKGIDG